MSVDILSGNDGAFIFCDTSDLPLPMERFDEGIEAEHFLLWWDRENGNYGEESDLRNLLPSELAKLRKEWADEYLDDNGLTAEGWKELT